MVSPLFCGSGKAVEVIPPTMMKSAASAEKLDQKSDFTSRVKHLLSTSPLKKRRAASLSAINTASSSLAFGVSLIDLVTQEGREVPRLVSKVVGHVEKEGLDQEGVYRVNGNAKVIEKLKASFDKVGDASFKNEDLYAIAGLLKLFLRQLPSPVIPEDLVPHFVDLQRENPGTATPQALLQLKEVIAQLPSVNYVLLKYLIRHIQIVAQHSDQNKMTAVSLAIVFGPNIFRCGGGLEGLRQQGYTNSVVCRMVQNYQEIFESPSPASPQPMSPPMVSPEVPQHGSGIDGRKRPSRPRPYSEYVEEKKHKVAMPHSPTALFPPSTPKGDIDHDQSFSERSIDEAVDRSSGTLSPSSPALIPSISIEEETDPFQQPTSPAHVVVIEPYKEKQEHENGTFHRQYAKRGMRFKHKSVSRQNKTAGSQSTQSDSTPSRGSDSRYEAGSHSQVTRSCSDTNTAKLKHRQVSALNAREEDTMRTPSPFSWQSSPGTSPPTSPALTPRSSNVVSSVIQASVRHFLFEPPSASHARQPDSLQGRTNGRVATADVYGLLLPDKADSPRLKKRLAKPMAKQSAKHDATDSQTQQQDKHVRIVQGDVAVSEGVDEVDSGELRPDVAARVGSESEADRGKKGELSSRGKVSQLVQQFDETDSGDTPEDRTKNGVISDLPRKKKPGLKAFEMFEKSGMLMGMPAPSDRPPSILREPSDDLTTVTRPQLSTTASDDDVFHSPTTSLTPATPQHGGSVFQRASPSTTSDDVFVSPQHAATPDSSFEELDVVSSSKKLQHINLSRPDGPARRKPPRARSSPTTHVGEDSTDGVGPSVQEQGKTVSEGGTPLERRKIVSPKGSVKQRAESNSAGSSNTRVPLLDLTSLAPESSLEVKEGWSEAPKVERDTQPSTNLQTAKQLSHRIHELKIIVKDFEAEFVAGHGHKPSGTERAPIRPQLEEVVKLRKQLKGMYSQTDDSGLKQMSSSQLLSQTAPAELAVSGVPSGSVERLVQISQEATTEDLSPRSERKDKKRTSRQWEVKPPQAAVEEPDSPLKTTLERLLVVLEEKRRRDGRPEDLNEMTTEQVQAEKQAIQKALLQFEKLHGRPQSKQEKETMRPLYDKYRLVKKFIAKGDFRKIDKEHSTTSPEAMEVTTDSLPSVTLLQPGLTQSLPVEVPQKQPNNAQLSKSALELSRTDMLSRVQESMTEKQLQDASLDELCQQYDIMLQSKKEIRKVLKDYENGFVAMHGRAVMKEDRKRMQTEYGMYKSIKAKLILIETLITKKDPQRTF